MPSHSDRYLAIDPGKTSGWATFDEQGNGITMGQANVIELLELLDQSNAHTIITEDYKLYPWKRDEQIWSRLDTVRIIGMIQYFCWKNQRNLVLRCLTLSPLATCGQVSQKHVRIKIPTNETLMFMESFISRKMG